MTPATVAVFFLKKLATQAAALMLKSGGAGGGAKLRAGSALSGLFFWFGFCWELVQEARMGGQVLPSGLP